MLLLHFSSLISSLVLSDKRLLNKIKLLIVKLNKNCYRFTLRFVVKLTWKRGVGSIIVEPYPLPLLFKLAYSSCPTFFGLIWIRFEPGSLRFRFDYMCLRRKLKIIWNQKLGHQKFLYFSFYKMWKNPLLLPTLWSSF